MRRIQLLSRPPKRPTPPPWMCAHHADECWPVDPLAESIGDANHATQSKRQGPRTLHAKPVLLVVIISSRSAGQPAGTSW
jgi:hypothetical protein